MSAWPISPLRRATHVTPRPLPVVAGRIAMKAAITSDQALSNSMRPRLKTFCPLSTSADLDDTE